jgi:predicted small metal-binding protein
MAKYYYISCKEAGIPDCDYSTTANSIEQVVEECAAHARALHGMKGFGPEVYSKMRPHIRVVDETAPAT